MPDEDVRTKESEVELKVETVKIGAMPKVSVPKAKGFDGSSEDKALRHKQSIKKLGRSSSSEYLRRS